MYLEGISEARSLAGAAIASIEKHGIAATPENYALWYEYHGDYNESLRATMDVVALSGTFDEATLHDLYRSFLSSANEEKTVRETSIRVQETLQEVIGIADSSLADTRAFGTTLNGAAASDFDRSIESLRALIEHLVKETERMASRSEYAGFRMRESADKIEALERNLENALKEATTDGLTGVANRKSFDGALRREAGDALNSGNDLSLLLVDVDHFKRVNDTWGHPTGDALLCGLARTIQRAVRPQDHVARYGGEEFAVILANTNGTDAVCVGDRIREALARMPFPDGPPDIGRITVSIGVACYDPGEALTDWVGRTDGALYRAKREGRDRVIFA